MKNVLEPRYITLFSTKSPTKAQMVERLIRTLRARQERINTHSGSRRWVESFPKLVKSYNATTHSALPKNMTPKDVNLTNERAVWEYLYSQNFNLKGSKRKQIKTLAVGTPVHISKRKCTLKRHTIKTTQTKSFS